MLWNGNVEKNVFRISRISNTDYDRCKTAGECGIFQLFMITNEARCKWEIKFRIAMVKAAFNKKTLFTSKLHLHLRKKLVECYLLSTAL
jgi:hypothetical protein